MNSMLSIAALIVFGGLIVAGYGSLFCWFMVFMCSMEIFWWIEIVLDRIKNPPVLPPPLTAIEFYPRQGVLIPLNA
jgi:hypothetical protein